MNKKVSSRKKASKASNIADVMGASYIKRIMAYFIDMLVVSLVMYFPMKGLFSGMIGDEETFSSLFAASNEMSFSIFLLDFVLALVFILYFALLEFKLSQTVGKMMMGLEVKSVIGELTFRQCFMRNISKMSVMFLFIDSIYGLFKGTRRRFLEKYSSTVVVNK
ncbi:RDD family protein [Candidatus Woesearchaeota archaeon]|nr:RDD family protein [Candidatus Woesearchaeota archaeon]MBT3438801.1 RDD family protein [Candidatus Woesearchaeota archaeon]MBT4058390.1 RDD family protein [Candidatus Woesearchaeota archaeon]MBT5112044.1 RDD family protein [Candidatus Woesearchaeota archaeon]MBT5558172.1 RDD family protein [Candidatus Woesearchaeota archaeon]